MATYGNHNYQKLRFECAQVAIDRNRSMASQRVKESKHDRFGKRPAANAAEQIDERSTEADMSAFRRSIGLFSFVVFFFYDRLRTLVLRFLL